MEIKPVQEKLLALLSKYRYAVLILVIGVALMLLPSTSQPQETEPEESAAPSTELSVEQRLSQLLSQIDGAGRVEVMLSLAAGEQTVYQTDTDTSTETDRASVRSDTVTITDADRNQSGLVTQVNPPIYQGAIIVCQGAENPNVKLAIVDAVSKYTGLKANQISVLKMK